MNIRRTKDSFSFQSSSRIEIAHETWSWWSLLGFFFVLKRRASNSVTRWLAYFSTFGLCINENLPNGIQSLPKLVQDFPKKKINPQKFAQDFEDFAKIAKFRQIWSHCWQLVTRFWCVICGVLKWANHVLRSLRNLRRCKLCCGKKMFYNIRSSARKNRPRSRPQWCGRTRRIRLQFWDRLHFVIFWSLQYTAIEVVYGNTQTL